MSAMAGSSFRRARAPRLVQARLRERSLPEGSTREPCSIRDIYDLRYVLQLMRIGLHAGRSPAVMPVSARK